MIYVDERTDYSRNVRVQGVGSFIGETHRQSVKILYRELYRIDHQNMTDKLKVDRRLDEALCCIDEAFEFIGTPENILGNPSTKHGEIAEHTDVALHNAHNAMKGKPQNATFENVGRTAPEDYLVDGVAVQSKYINSSSNSLTKVLDHLEKYRDIGFGRDESYYVIPKDQYEEIQRVLSGDAGSLNAKSVRAILNKVKEIEMQTGRPFSEVVKSGNVDYAEVQQGAIHKTLHKETKKLREEAKKEKSEIDSESKKEKSQAYENAKPTWKKAAVSAGISAGISGGFSLAFGIRRKLTEGKSIQNFTTEDWKEIGLDTVKGTAEGGISGLAIYGLTAVMKVPSPVAAAGVSLTMGLVELTHEYCTNKISREDFVTGCQTVGLNSIVSAVGAFIGDKVIPIPVLGSVIGSAVAGNICKEIIGQGILAAKAYAAEYVHGSTVTMLRAAEAISANHQITTYNLMTIRKEHEEIAQGIDDFLSQMGGLL